MGLNHVYLNKLEIILLILCFSQLMKAEPIHVIDSTMQSYLGIIGLESWTYKVWSADQ